MDKGNPKRANGGVTRGREGEIPLDLLNQTMKWGRGNWREREEERKRERGKRGKREKKKEEREAPLSRFPKDQTVSVRRSKRQS